MLSEAGIRFDKHQTQGIDPQLFSEYLIASGTFFFVDSNPEFFSRTSFE